MKKPFTRISETKILVYGSILFSATVLLASKACHNLEYNRTLKTAHYTLVSRSTATFGHEEFITFADGSVEFKAVPSSESGHIKMCFAKRDGGLADKVMEYTGRHKLLTLSTDRPNEYLENKELYDFCDRKLQGPR